ncbi:hypothetical protein LP316_11805 [Thalassotalea sp. LPB0316]|uniref:hypothetical protein n=1 Tax=Thalassotalea sp. LPB0316 TaxID=2769490 RepID=UPI001867E366|nr:hypothetical protein [Thalassotalea sp. LPB0316]QOL24986.1 hypothetical protein LP316_11805 [Thalassotalea sp. LPB0316]
MKLYIALVIVAALLNGCVVAPITDKAHSSKCMISTDRKVLKIIDVAKESNTFYSISGLIISPILVPTTAIISGTYVLVNNTYRLGEETIKCRSEA